MSTSASCCSRPMPSMRRVNAMAPPVAIMVFEGMQSHRWAAPPMTSRSMSVTSAPKRAACVAAVLPAGPPPMITKRVDTTDEVTRGYAAAVSDQRMRPVMAARAGRTSIVPLTGRYGRRNGHRVQPGSSDTAAAPSTA